MGEVHSRCAMNKTFHFIAGLPRSGSSLLSSILNQNPRFHSEISDPVADFFMSMFNVYSQENHYRVICPHDRMANTLNGLIDGYYAHINKEVVFNTNRAWTKITECLQELNPDFKIICMVRDYAAVLNSFEVLYKNRGFVDPLRIYNGNTSSVYSRTNYLARESSVRYSYDALKEAYFGPHADHLLLVEYDDLVSNPQEMMQNVYEFIDEPYYNHNFNNVSSSYDDYDDSVGLRNLHTVHTRVKNQYTRTVLPPDLYNQYKNLEFWRNA